MKLQLPLKNFEIIQYFGNASPTYSQLGILGHNGLDLVATHGTPVYASHDGTAHFEVDNYSGHGVVVIADTPIEGTQSYFKTIYWHLCDSSVEPKFKSPIEDGYKKVKAGDLLGYADNTGLSSGNHLHWGLKLVDKNGDNLNYDNGFKGAIDPFPYMPIVKYYFGSVMTFGQSTTPINHLQHFLYQHGYMGLVPYSQMGIYGNKTAEAVLKFQIDHIKLSFWERYFLRGKTVGGKTLEVLNNI